MSVESPSGSSIESKAQALSLSPEADFSAGLEESARVLVVACGALAREILAIIELNGWQHVRLHCLPAILHNTPLEIPDRLRDLIRKQRREGEKVIVVYSDCGAQGQIEAVCHEEGADYIGGAHCFQLFAGPEAFSAMMEEAPGTFFLTDFLAKHFDVFVTKSLGLDRYPQLASSYFGNYTKLIYVAQTEDEALQAKARAAAEQLGLEYHFHFGGYGDYETYLKAKVS